MRYNKSEKVTSSYCAPSERGQSHYVPARRATTGANASLGSSNTAIYEMPYSMCLALATILLWIAHCTQSPRSGMVAVLSYGVYTCSVSTTEISEGRVASASQQMLKRRKKRLRQSIPGEPVYG